MAEPETEQPGTDVYVVQYRTPDGPEERWITLSVHLLEGDARVAAARSGRAMGAQHWSMRLFCARVYNPSVDVPVERSDS